MIDPFRILGLSPQADDQAIRHAYLEAIRQCPPERDPQRFERIRAAYEAVRDKRRRLVHELFHVERPTAADVLEWILTEAATPKRPELSHLLQVLGGR
jgi:curved DNA-binding protein CbpA